MTYQRPGEVRPCAGPGCDRRLVATTTWRGYSVQQRQALRAAGTHKHQARGLCARCYDICSTDGTLVDYERRTVPLPVVLEEWAWLHEHGFLSRAESRSARCRQAAPKLGMSPAALARALERAGVAA